MIVEQPRMKVEIHVLKNYPYSNLNRDEFGTPKTCTFADMTHGRISSQSLKRSWREYFKNYYDADDISVRTRLLPRMVKEYLTAEGKDEKYVNEAVDKIKSLFKKEDKGNKSDEGDGDKNLPADMTKQILPLTPAEILFFKEEFAKYDSINEFDAKSFSKKLEDLGTTVDIALCGRMITSPVIESPEAAMQVAHAISTNAVNIETDFFSAVDDMATDGAAIIDNAEYNSCCYYEYACIDFEHLVENLGGDEEKAKAKIPEVIKTIAYANPSGKSASTATNILPAAVLVEVKEVPYSLVNAFEIPCTNDGAGLVANSEAALIAHCEKMYRKFRVEGKRVYFSLADAECACAENVESFPELIEKVASYIG